MAARLAGLGTSLSRFPGNMNWHLDLSWQYFQKKTICLPDPQQPGGTVIGHQLQGSWQDQDHKRAAVNLHW